MSGVIWPALLLSTQQCFLCFFMLSSFVLCLLFCQTESRRKLTFIYKEKGMRNSQTQQFIRFILFFYSFSKETKKMGFKYTCVVLLLCVIFHSSQAKHLKKDKSTKKGMDLLWVRINRNRSFLSTVFFFVLERRRGRGASGNQKKFFQSVNFNEYN